MRTTIILRAAAAVTAALAMAGCGGAADPSMVGPGDFAGVYDATWSSLAHITSPPGVPDQPYTDSGVMTVGADVTADFIGSVTNSVGSFCDGLFDRTSPTHATFSPPMQTWTGVLTNGNTQTNHQTCTADLSGAGGTLVVTCDGTITGVTPQGVQYAGNYHGAWTGTKR
jgi:hypothetical protein